MPPFLPPTCPAPAKATAASILREHELLLKKQKKEQEVLQRYETELRDASGYYDWQYEVKKQDMVEERLQVERRRVEMQLARDEAIRARDKQLKANHGMANAQKNEMEKKLFDKEKKYEKLMVKKKELVGNVRAERVRPRDAESQVREDRARAAAKLKKEKAVAEARAHVEMSFEMARRKDLIRQIRAVELVSTVRPGPYDPSEPPQHGLLEEMALSELHERLKLVRERHAREVEDKRKRNLRMRAEKHETLMKKARDLARIRSLARAEAQKRHEALRERNAKC